MTTGSMHQKDGGVRRAELPRDRQYGRNPLIVYTVVGKAVPRMVRLFVEGRQFGVERQVSIVSIERPAQRFRGVSRWRENKGRRWLVRGRGYCQQDEQAGLDNWSAEARTVHAKSPRTG